MLYLANVFDLNESGTNRLELGYKVEMNRAAVAFALIGRMKIMLTREECAAILAAAQQINAFFSENAFFGMSVSKDTRICSATFVSRDPWMKIRMLRVQQVYGVLQMGERSAKRLLLLLQALLSHRVEEMTKAIPAIEKIIQQPKVPLDTIVREQNGGIDVTTEAQIDLKQMMLEWNIYNEKNCIEGDH
jgi:hypothetical protein